MSYQFALTPRDGLFLKDGRGWYTSDIGRSYGYAWPHPPTIRGALRAASGHAWMTRTGKSLDPPDWERVTEGVAIHQLIALRCPVGATATRAHRIWPTPADAFYCTGDVDRPVQRLDPEPPRQPEIDSLDRLDDPALAALWRPYRGHTGKSATRPAFWPESAMQRWLRGESVDTPGLDVPRRTDMHVTLSPDTHTAVPSMLFSTQVTEPIERDRARWLDWRLAMRCSLPHIDAPWREPITLGGRRRVAIAEPVAPDLFDPPADLGSDSPGLRLIVVTPAQFARGWLPDGFARHGASPQLIGALPGVTAPVILTAAIVARPINLSTWDMVRRAPRKTRRLVRPGAVYFFNKRDRSPFTTEERRSLWLAQLGEGRAEGLGLVLPGRWNRQGT